jgi:hypothetical protein
MAQPRWVRSLSFVTLNFTAQTGQTFNIAPPSVCLSGSVNPGGSTGTAFFLWGQASLSNSTPPISVAATKDKVPINACITVGAGTSYGLCECAQNE